MNALCRILLICWIPIILMIFLSRRPPRRALIVSVLATWLTLPAVGLEIPGFPDYTKSIAASFGCLLAVMLFDGSRLLSFRPRWYDLPVVVLGTSSVATSVLNGLGVYDGLSVSIQNVMWYVVPYFLGRIYLNDRESIEAATLAFVTATLIYAIPTLWEVRMSPNLSLWVYGVVTSGFQPPRFGLGYRPNVFLVHGLELGLWIAFAAIFAYSFLASRSRKDIQGIPILWVTLFLVFLSLMTKSVGAIIIMFSSIGILWGTRRLGNPILLWILLLIPIVYASTRMTGVWNGDQIVELTGAYLGPERESSIATRFSQENRLIARALEQPIFGWGGFSRWRVFDEYGRDITLSDGLWVILLGTQGLVGLISLGLVFLLPQANFLILNRKTQWKSPQLTTTLAVVVFCGMFTIDSLLNAEPNPFYLLLIGGLSGITAVRQTSPIEQATAYLTLGEGLVEVGEHDEAEAAYRAAIVGFTTSGLNAADEWIGRGEASRSLGHLLETQGRYEEAHEAYVAAVRVYEEAPGPATPALREAWSAALDALARDLKAQGRGGDAEVALRRSVEVFEPLMAAASADERIRRAYADRMNDLAWLLVMPDDPDRADAVTAVALARRAATLQPEEPCFWNTLAVALLQTGDDRGAIEAAGRSIELTERGTPFDHYIMAMACTRLGDSGVGHQWFHRGEQARADQPVAVRDLERIRAQAEAILATAEAGEASLALPGE